MFQFVMIWIGLGSYNYSPRVQLLPLSTDKCSDTKNFTKVDDIDNLDTLTNTSNLSDTTLTTILPKILTDFEANNTVSENEVDN